MPASRRAQTHVRRRYRPVGGTSYDKFTPFSISGLQVWLDAQQEAFADGDAIGQLTDWSGNGKHFTQATALNKPTFKVDVVGGRPAALFTAANLQKVESADLSASFPTAATLFVVGNPNSDNEYGMYDTSTAAGATYFRFNGDGNGYWGLFRGARVNAVAGVVTTGNHMWVIRSSAAAYDVWRNGTSLTSTAANYAAGTTQEVGRNQDGSYLNGYVAEVLAYNVALTAANINTIGNYVQYKYGITWTTVA